MLVNDKRCLLLFSKTIRTIEFKSVHTLNQSSVNTNNLSIIFVRIISQFTIGKNRHVTRNNAILGGWKNSFRYFAFWVVVRKPNKSCYNAKREGSQQSQKPKDCSFHLT